MEIESKIEDAMFSAKSGTGLIDYTCSNSTEDELKEIAVYLLQDVEPKIIKHRPQTWEDLRNNTCGGCDQFPEECGVYSDAVKYPLLDPNYPEELQYNSEGAPICTAHGPNQSY